MAEQVFQRGLLVQLAGLGDLVMALPAIDALLARYPDTAWTLLTRPPQAGLLEGRDIEVVTMPWPPATAALPTQLSTLMSLRKRRFSMALHLYSPASTRGAWAIRALFGLIGADRTVGRVRDDQSIFDTSWDESQISSRHETDLNLALLSTLDIDAPYTPPAVTVASGVTDNIRNLLQGSFPAQPPLAVLFSGGARPTRHWPVENYMALIRYLRRQGMGVCIVGGRSEMAEAEQMASGDPQVISLAGKLSLSELAALIGQAKIYIGNDSGPSHLAAAVGTPAVVLFGPGDAERYAPRGRSEVRIARFGVDCAPCYLQHCSHHTCMRSLTVDAVRAEVDAVLAGVPAA